MKILLVTSDLPTASTHHGGGKHTFQWVKELTDSCKYKWSLLSFLRNEDRSKLKSISGLFEEIRTVPAERSLSNRISRTPLLARVPFAVAANYSKILLRNLREMIADGTYDCVQFENFHLGQYARRINHNIPRILVLQDIASDVIRQQVRIASGIKKYYFYREWKLSRYWEKWYSIWSGNIFLMSLKDKRTVESWDIGVKTFIMPPLINQEALCFSADRREPATILFVGAMHRPGNLDAVLRMKNEILPLVWREYPNARCIVVGASPPPSVRALSGDNFIVTGAVERVEPYFASASLLAVPLRVSGGIILKIIQAMTAGCPVIATRSANSGIEAGDGSEILIADRASDFAAAIIKLLKAPDQAIRIGRAGQEWVMRNYNRTKCRDRLDRAYRSIIESGKVDQQ